MIDLGFGFYTMHFGLVLVHDQLPFTSVISPSKMTFLRYLVSLSLVLPLAFASYRVDCGQSAIEVEYAITLTKEAALRAHIDATLRVDE